MCLVSFIPVVQIDQKYRGEIFVMRKVIFLASILIVLHISTLVHGNPIPAPNAIEEIHADIYEVEGKLYDHFSAEYFCSFSSPEEVNEILYPIIDGVTSLTLQGSTGSEYGVHNWEDVTWEWSESDYPTVLPEYPTIPIMRWPWPFPVIERNENWMETLFKVSFDHELIKRDDEFIFFYPMGVWKILENIPNEYREIILQIAIPDDYMVRNAWLDNDTCNYSMWGNGCLLVFYVPDNLNPYSSLSLENLNKDIIVSIGPKPDRLCVQHVYPVPGSVHQYSYPDYYYDWYKKGVVGTDYFYDDLNVSVTFTEAVDAISVHEGNVSIIRSGGDDVFGNDNDVELTPYSVSIETDNKTVRWKKGGAVVQSDLYQITIGAEGDPVMTDEDELLDGEANQYFPSGDGTPGGHYVATFRIENEFNEECNTTNSWQLYQ